MVPVSRPDISVLEQSLVAKAVESTWISSAGYFIDEFEATFSSLNRSKYCLTTTNGTTALHLALLGLGIKSGDVVIVPSFTYIASVNCIKYCGATPVFAEINADNWCISVDSISSLVTPKTKAVIAVHIYGRCADISSLRKFCDDNKLFLIEDVAEAPFAKLNGIQAGSLGDISTFSFFGNKIVSSGEGGAVTTSNIELYEKMKIIRNQGMDPNVRYFFSQIGYNYRMTNIAAAILVGQLERLSEMWDRRCELYASYRNILNGFDFIQLQDPVPDETISPWLFPVLLDNGARRNAVIEHLSQSGIDSRPFFIPIHSLPIYREIESKSTFELTNSISARGMNLPTSSAFTDDEIKTLLSGVKSAFEHA